jgi:hypothetical protein
MADPYKTSFATLRTNTSSLLLQCMNLDSVSRWRGELINRCEELLRAIAWVESDDRAMRIDAEKQAREAQS